MRVQFSEQQFVEARKKQDFLQTEIFSKQNLGSEVKWYLVVALETLCECVPVMPQRLVCLLECVYWLAVWSVCAVGKVNVWSADVCDLDTSQ